MNALDRHSAFSQPVQEKAGGGWLCERWLFRDVSQRTSRKPGRGNKLKEVGWVDYGFEEAANHKRVREKHA